MLTIFLLNIRALAWILSEEIESKNCHWKLSENSWKPRFLQFDLKWPWDVNKGHCGRLGPIKAYNYAKLQLSISNSYRITAHNVFSLNGPWIGPGPGFGKKRYLCWMVYGGEQFCRVSELYYLNSLRVCKKKVILARNPIFEFRGPWWPNGLSRAAKLAK